MAKLRAALGILWLIGLAGAAAADVQSTTTYNYFPVTGKTARQIYVSMLKHGPAQGDPTAMASTNIKLSQHPAVVLGPQCKMKRFTARLKFRINLPRHSDLNALSPELRKTWTSFAADLKIHEEHHRALWISCADRLTRQALQLPSGSCVTFKNAYVKFARSFASTCKAENNAFDRSDEARMLQTPFIRRVVADR